MKLTDEMIEEEANYIAEFRSGAKFARDYYETQIAGFIDELDAALECSEGGISITIRRIFDRFEGKDGSNP